MFYYVCMYFYIVFSYLCSFIICLALLLHLILWTFYRRQHLTRLNFTICIVITNVNAMRLSCIAYHDYGLSS